MAYPQANSGYAQSGLVDGPLSAAQLEKLQALQASSPREMTLKERVFEQQQRIGSLEAVVEDLRKDIRLLADVLHGQVGAEF